MIIAYEMRVRGAFPFLCLFLYIVEPLVVHSRLKLLEYIYVEFFVANNALIGFWVETFGTN